MFGLCGNLFHGNSPKDHLASDSKSHSWCSRGCNPLQHEVNSVHVGIAFLELLRIYVIPVPLLLS